MYADRDKSNVMAENFEKVRHLIEHFGNVDTEKQVRHVYEEI